MDIREMRELLGDTQSSFSKRYGIPFRTLQNWEGGKRTPPEYIIRLLEERVIEDSLNRKTYVLSPYDPKKKSLPERKDYVSPLSWLKALKEILGEDFVFALDEALMCQEMFTGRDDEYYVYGYGKNGLLRYNGIVLLSNCVSHDCVMEKEGVKYTGFIRTLTDSLANEDILDMQGITEALSMYYFAHSESFDGLYVPLKYQERFERLKEDAVSYYSE